MIKWLAAALILALLIISPVALPLAAADSFAIRTVNVYRNLVAAADALVVVHYDIHYDTIPSVDIDKYWTFRLYNYDATLLGATSPYAYYHKGFDEGVVAFYLADASGLLWDSAAYVKAEGSPAYFSDPIPYAYYTLTPDDYASSSSRDTNRQLLTDKIIDIAKLLESDWTASLTGIAQNRTILDGGGVTYFKSTIYGIEYMAPQLFSTTTSTMNVTSRNWTNNLVNSITNRYNGTWVQNSLQGGASLLGGGVQWNFISGGAILILCLVIYGLSAKRFGNTIPGAAGSGAVFFTSGWAGLVAWPILAIGTGLSAIYLIWMLIWRRG